MRISNWITSKIKSVIITQLSVTVHLEKKPQIYSTNPIKPNIKDSDILYAVDKFILPSNAINAVAITITIELRHMLNNAYFDNRMPNKILVISRQHPMIIVFFIRL